MILCGNERFLIDLKAVATESQRKVLILMNYAWLTELVKSSTMIFRCTVPLSETYLLVSQSTFRRKINRIMNNIIYTVINRINAVNTKQL